MSPKRVPAEPIVSGRELSDDRPRPITPGPLLLAAAAGAAIGVAASTGLFLAAVYAAVVALLASLGAFQPRLAIPWTVGLLLVLGAIRRWTEWKWGVSQGIDPLLAVQPALAAVLLVVAVRVGALREPSPLSAVVRSIVVIGSLGALNPLQGSLATGIVGAVIFLTPVAWFYIGRALVDDRTLAQVYVVVVVASVVAAVYGIRQADGSFFAFDRAWFEGLEGYASLRVGGDVVRPFGLASSAAEFGKNLGIATAVSTAILIGRGRGRRIPMVGVLGLLGLALVLSGLRTTLVLTAVAVGVVWGVRRRVSLAWLGAVGLAAVLLLLVAVQLVAPTAFGDSSSGTLANRSLGGLASPFDTQDSSLVGHIDVVVDALAGLPANPIGLGTGSTTLAGKQFGEARSADMDLGDAALSLGVAGVVAYLMLCVRLARRATAVAAARQDWLAAAAIGVVVVTALQWFNGGLYSAVTLAWLTFGWLDRPDQPVESQPAIERATVAVSAPSTAT